MSAVVLTAPLVGSDDVAFASVERTSPIFPAIFASIAALHLPISVRNPRNSIEACFALLQKGCALAVRRRRKLWRK